MPTTVAQEQVQERHRDFTMVPNILIDSYDELSDAFRFGFLKFMRMFRKDGCFVGSLRKLGKKLKVARMTINRMVDAWVKSHLVEKHVEDAESDTVRITLQLQQLWEANTNSYPVTICDTSPSENESPVTVCDNTVTERDTTVTICDEVSQPQAQNEDNIYIYKEDNKKIDISLTNVSDALPRYETGLKPLPYPDLDIFAEDLQSQAAIGDEAAQLPMQPAVQVTPMSTPTKETKKRGNVKKVVEEKPSGPPQKPPDEMAWSTRKCLMWFLYWRGKPLIGTYNNSKASTCAKGLAENYTEEEVLSARSYMHDVDPYWSQRPEAVDICTVANHIHEKLREAQKKPTERHVSSAPVPQVQIRTAHNLTGIGSQPRRNSQSPQGAC